MRVRLRRGLTVILAVAATMVFISDFLQTLQTLNHQDPFPRYGAAPYNSDELSNGWTAPTTAPQHAKLSFLAFLREKIFNTFNLTVGSPPQQVGSHVWPSGAGERDDRILRQMKYIPESVRDGSEETGLKVILVLPGLSDARAGQQRFIDDQCPVNTCTITDKRDKGPTADAVLFQNAIIKPPFRKSKEQVWILFYLESPHHTGSLSQFNHLFNWTATYRRDSTIVTPYEKYVPYENVTSLPSYPIKNYAAGKSKQVAWFVSNCRTKNNRFNFVTEMLNFIDVDIYGACGSHSCPRTRSNDCYQMLSKQYKFYLAFENSNCKDYITEKFFWNGLLNDVVPVVMGARKEDYTLVAPPNSFIHVDDFDSPKELALYLLKLDQNDDLYNQYFLWKDTGRYINTKFYCRLCAMLHDPGQRRWYRDIQHWWAGPEVCVEATSRNPWASWKRHRPRRRGKISHTNYTLHRHI